MSLHERGRASNPGEMPAAPPRRAPAYLASPVVLAADSYAPSSVPDMIRSTFGPYAWQALAIARCESSDNPWATNSSSGAAGVFQFLWSTWQGTSYAGYSPYDAWANVSAAHEVFVRDGYSWREWSCGY
jgi:hypothetical protein